MGRKVYEIGRKVRLLAGNQEKEFMILDAGKNADGLWYRQGGSTICYDAAYSDDAGLHHYGKLKMFYLDDESKDFDMEADAYITAYRSLHELVSKDKEMSLVYAFIPNFEIYYDANACPWIWTDAIPMLTFEEMCQKIMVRRGYIEDALFQIVTTLKALTDCIRVLHENHLIHGDITPSNFGFYLRDGKILNDGVSLFDLNTLRYVWQEHKWYTEPYYESLPNDGDQGNRADIRAIGVCLCKALLCDEGQIERIKQASSLSNKQAKESVEKEVFSSEMFVQMGIPRNPHVCEQLITVILETVTKLAGGRISSCMKLYQRLQMLETYLLPDCTRDELGRGIGIEIVNKEERRKNKIRKVFQYLLYDNPLYLWQRDDGENNRTCKILILGFGFDAQNFLDVCLETGQAMEEIVEVSVWGTPRMKRERAYYLKERPALEQFFLVDGKEEKLTGEPYGKINFNFRKGAALHEQIENVVLACKDVQYIYIASGNDTENAQIAEIFASLLPDKKVSINVQCEHERRDTERIHYVCVEDMIKHTKVRDEIERMSLNTHLIWSGSKNADLEKKHKDYDKDYYRLSCLSNVLSIKYKLHNMGINLSDGAYEAARKLGDQLQGNSVSRKRMISAEHRRWVTEKLCDGWIHMSVEDSLQYQDTKDLYGKRHICIVRSGEELGLAQPQWQDREKWDHATVEEIYELDELDQMSVMLHQAYKKGEKDFQKDDIFSEYVARGVLLEAEGFDSVQQIFLEWKDSLQELFESLFRSEFNSKEEEKHLAGYEALYTKLLDEIKKLGAENEIRKQSILNKVGAMYRGFLPITRCLRYHDYKKKGVELIENIPFILTYTENVTLIVPMDYEVLVRGWDDVRPTELFSYVAAATVINPRKVYLPYFANGFRKTNDADIIAQKERCIREYVKRKGLQTEISLVQLEAKTKISDIVSAEIGTKPGGWVFLEENGIGIVEMDRWAESCAHVGRYVFDMINMTFRTDEKAAWLNDINREVSITARDIAGFLGRKAIVKEQPTFQKSDIRILHKIYQANRAAWQGICRLLETSENKNDIVVRFRKITDRTGGRMEQHIFLLPYSCYRAVESILDLLKKNNIIEGSSSVFRYSVDACKIIIYEKNGYGPVWKELFAKQYLLTSVYDYSLLKKNGNYTLRCDSLSIAEIAYDFYADSVSMDMLKTLEELQRNGFLMIQVKKKSFDITYGSRQIKELFMEEGKFLEIYTYYRAKEMNLFHDVVTGLVLSDQKGKRIENEIDCIVTKGFQTVLIECKARALHQDDSGKEEWKKIREALKRKVLKYGINGTGLLVLDNERGEYYERVSAKTH